MHLGQPAYATKSDVPRLWSQSVSLHEASFTDGLIIVTGPRFTLSVSELAACFSSVGRFRFQWLRVVSIGRIVEQKGQAILIQAVARLLERGCDVKLVIVGDGPMRADIEALIDRLGLKDHVRITGYLSNQGVCDELLAARRRCCLVLPKGFPEFSSRRWRWGVRLSVRI